MALFKPSDFLPAASGRCRSFYSYLDAPLTAINAKYKPKEATFDILEVKRFIFTRANRFVERFLHSAEMLQDFLVQALLLKISNVNKF